MPRKSRGSDTGAIEEDKKMLRECLGAPRRKEKNEIKLERSMISEL